MTALGVPLLLAGKITLIIDTKSFDDDDKKMIKIFEGHEQKKERKIQN